MPYPLHRLSPRIAMLGIGFGLVSIGCAGTAPARAIRPTAPTAKTALGEEDMSCRASETDLLVVDWPSQRRA
jgi:hypothetical protein